jgi:hypothetical protein
MEVLFSVLSVVRRILVVNHGERRTRFKGCQPKETKKGAKGGVL